MPNGIIDPNIFLEGTPPETPPEQQEINEINEEDYLKKIRAKNKKKLVRLDFLERERVATHIKSLYDEVKAKHSELEDDIDEYDDIFRMKRETADTDKDSDDDTPDYRSPLSTVTLEVVHSNYMNVFFTPKDVMRVLPTEEGDVSKITKLDTFGNWSMANEMKIFEGADRLFHSSSKNGECPYAVYWVKEYGIEIKIEPVMNPLDPTQPLIDEDTKEPVTQEREEPKILYNGPRLEIFSRKDYILPENAMADRLPDWEMRRIRLNADKVNRYEKEGKYYKDTFDDISGWGMTSSGETTTKDKEGNDIPLGKSEKIFVEFYGRLRINAIKTDKEGDEAYEELEDEFIAVIELESETLCELRKNRFPLKMRPTGLDVFIPDDEGRIGGTGIMEFMDGPQNCYDALFNQHLFGTVQSNNPTVFFSPTGNMRNEPIKMKAGYMYPSSDPKSINIVKIPAPDASLRTMMEEVRNWAQLLFGIGDYQAGIESRIDPRAPAKKAEIVVAQGNVRLNLIIKRKNKTLKDIFKRWFLLYQANMPENKFMRIAGAGDTPWKFEKINMTDFALKSIPDFELTGNILNANKTLEAQKRVAIYDRLSQNFLFNPATQPGLQAYHALTKWFVDGFDEPGVSSFLPPAGGEQIQTPEEENARFLQGDTGEPTEGEDHINHIRVHNEMLGDPTTLEEIKKEIARHIAATYQMLRTQITQQAVMSRIPQGGRGGGVPQGAPGAPEGVVPERGMGRPEVGAGAGI